ncbi:alpha/beta hydrolase [Pacificimonas aurantium]|uniref:Alpha/beta hydrolase n=1 Tax=Pacificimonas aurantium TaxID=1250540 RepID=A0ABS7WKL4_9SPHN|nr:alpha/beta hydrolase [Pacificimonas aurantium]
MTERRIVDIAREDGEAAAAPASDPLVIGETFELVALGESREVNVVLPATYGEDPDARYPVLYLLDGGTAQDLLHVAGTVQLGALWGRNAEAIVVGVETQDRQRELLPETEDASERERWPTAGDSAEFRTFLREEVVPLVEANFRADGPNVLIGESAAGHFVVETWLSDPGMFDAYAAISPSLQWSDQALARGAAELLASGGERPPLYFATANEGGATSEGFVRFAAALPEGEGICINPRPDLFHGTIYHTVTPEAVQFLLPRPEPLPPEYGMTVRCMR